MHCKQCKGKINPSRGDLAVRISVIEHPLVKSGAQSYVWEEPTDTGTFCDGFCAMEYIEEHKDWYRQSDEAPAHVTHVTDDDVIASI
jgi:hypothetical protein